MQATRIVFDVATGTSFEETYEFVGPTLEELKLKKKSEIKSAFEAAPSYGFDTSFGYKMDSKREDIDNMWNLRSYAEGQVYDAVEANIPESDASFNAAYKAQLAATTVTIRDFNNEYHIITIPELGQLISEMIGFGLSLYQKKWELENQIDGAISEVQLAEISW